MPKIKLLKSSQKMRIIINDVAIYTTAKQIRWGLFGFVRHNLVAQKALTHLELTRQHLDATGIASTFEDIPVQLDML
jgi:hypothetical protein